ncbi:MAG: flippase [Rikenellaceae bacterium]
MINTISGMLFPIITFPYVSRVLLADGLGKINFLNSIISYISLLSCLGIPLYAVREIAKVRSDARLLSKTASEILILHLGLTLIGYMIVFALSILVDKINADIVIFFILSFTLIFTTIGCEWLFQGVEDFKYITIRGLIVKVTSVVLLFCLVKSREDIVWYAVYTVVGVLGGNIFNFVRLRKYIKISDYKFAELNPLRHLKPALHIFVLNLIISIYVNLDTVMLGFRSDETAVGLYTAASRLSKMCLGITGALGTALLPRFSNLIANNDFEQFNRLASKAVRYIVAISLPIAAAMVVLSPSIIRLFAGDTYAPAIETLSLLSPIIVFIAISGTLGIQILYPQGKENIVILSTAIGALLNFTLNWFLIPTYAQNGAALATLFGELSVTLAMIILGRKYLPQNFLNVSYINYILGVVLMTISLVFIRLQHFNDITTLITSFVIGSTIYLLYLLATKDELGIMVKSIILKIIKR